MYKTFFIPFMFLIITVCAVQAGNPGGAINLPLPITYIYGYNNTLVIAEVINGRQQEVAFTSFESSDKGYWNYNGNTAGDASNTGRTGTKYYDLGSGAIDRTNLPAGKYVVSYWSKNGAATITGSNYSLIKATSDMMVNGWVYHECICQLSATGSVQLTGNVPIDELRLYPFSAQMTTYTYTPLIGMTSETDKNNSTKFFEYDEFSRLKCVKDQNGNIRKSYVYHFKNQL